MESQHPWYNIISANNNQNDIIGTLGNDLIFAETATDNIYGLGGDDCIFGSEISITTIYGGFGDDVIHGGNAMMLSLEILARI